MFEEHTWGADVKTYNGSEPLSIKKKNSRRQKTAITYRFMERSWEEQKERVRESHKATGNLRAELIAQKGGKNQKEWYLFYQGSGSYTGWVELPEAWEQPVVTLSGKELSCEKIAGTWQVYVENLEGFRSVTIRIKENDCADAENATEDTDRCSEKCVRKEIRTGGE